MRATTGAVLALVVLALMAISFVAGLAAGTAPSPTPRPSPTAPPSPSPRPTAEPGVAASAVVVPSRVAEVAAPITARVEAVLAEEGQRVSSGQLLIRLDSSTRQAAVELAEADVGRASAAVDRARTLVEQLPDDASAAQREAAEAELRLAEAELAVARSTLDAARVALRQTQVRAPFGGTVTDLAVGPGEQAVAGAGLAVVADMSGWLIETTSISQLDVVRVAVGDRALIRIDALPGLRLEGEVEQVRARGTQSPDGVRFDVVIRPDAHNPDLRWNMTASVRIVPAN